jgi:hypothetical protein
VLILKSSKSSKSQENTKPRKRVSQSDVPDEMKSQIPLSRALRNRAELDSVTSSRQSGLLNSLAEEVQVGEQLAGLHIGGAP